MCTCAPPVYFCVVGPHERRFQSPCGCKSCCVSLHTSRGVQALLYFWGCSPQVWGLAGCQHCTLGWLPLETSEQPCLLMMRLYGWPLQHHTPLCLCRGLATQVWVLACPVPALHLGLLATTDVRITRYTCEVSGWLLLHASADLQATDRFTLCTDASCSGDAVAS